MITIVSTTTTDRLDKVYILLNSIKQNKLTETSITYYIFIQFTQECTKDYCIEYFSSLLSSDFNIIVIDVDIFKNLVCTPGRNHIYYAKCLFPKYFSDCERLLFLDVDIVIAKNGIEDLWNSDIEDYYVGACTDPTWQYCPEYKFELQNTKTENYFNAGVLLLNNKKIKEDKKDEELAKWCLSWDSNKLKCVCYDQSLLNYLLKDKVKILDFKYNNTLLASLGIAKNAYDFYLNSLGYSNLLDSIKDAVILHFCGSNKPWKASIIQDNVFPYKKEAIEIWSKYTEESLNNYKKREAHKESKVINWAKYVDAIYCLHFLPYKYRIEKIKTTLNYLDILNSPIFHWYYTYPNAFDEMIVNFIKPTYCDYHNNRRTKTLNLNIAYHNMFREIQELGYNKVLLIEDDITFVYGRKNLFLETLKHLPENWDYIHFDKVRAGNRTKDLNTLQDGEYFCSNFTGGYYGGGFSMWSKKAINIAVKKQEQDLSIIDHLVINRDDCAPELNTLKRYVPKHTFFYQFEGIQLYDFV